MAPREKFGRLVLLDETDTDPIGSEYRAARLGPNGFDRLVSVLRFSSAVSAHAEATKRLVDEARHVSQLQTSSLVRVLGVGRVGQSFYVSTELAEGRTLRAILGYCGEEGFPFAVDHALMIASRAAAGLEYLHGRKDESGRATVHGLLTPSRIVVAFDGEVRLKGLGLWPALGPAGLLAPEECAYLAPEQASGEAQPRSDVYALGLVLLEALSAQATDDSDPLGRIAAARIAIPGGDPGPLPKPLLTLLRRALGRDPAARFGGIAEMRRAIDTLLFSGDFTPTTFDLAFFMHTLFRDQVERDTRAIEEAARADYREFLTDEAAKPASSPAAQDRPLDARPSVLDAKNAPLPTPVPLSTAPEAPSAHDTPVSHVAKAAPLVAGPDNSAARHARLTREPPARDPGRSPFGSSLPRAGPRRSLWLLAALVAAAALGGGAGWLYLVMQRRVAASAAASAEHAAAQARVHELEARIALLEKEKAEAEARAVEEARRTLEQQAAAGGQTADPAAIALAQGEARQRARAEQERKQQEERVRLAEAKRPEELRLAAAALAALATPAPLPTTSPVPAAFASAVEPSPANPSAAAASTATGEPAAPVAQPAPASTRPPADPTDPAVRPPGLISEDAVPYPPRAMSRRIAAVVVVRALVDENGRVTEAAIVQASGLPLDYGFEQAALRRVKGRRYRPASRNDVPVPIWVVVRVEFRPPR